MPGASTTTWRRWSLPMARSRTRPPLRERLNRRRETAGPDWSKEIGIPISGARPRPPRAIGNLNRRLAQPHWDVGKEHAERNKQMLNVIEEDALRTLSPDELGGLTLSQFRRELQRMILRLGVHAYTSGRLRRSRGLRWAWYGEVCEIVFWNHVIRRTELLEYAVADLRTINDRLGSASVEGLVNGRGLKFSDLPQTQRPKEPFPTTSEIATDLYLVYPDGTREKYVDRGLVSFTGSGDSRFMAAAADVEIKAVGQKSAIGEQFSRQPGRRKRAALIEMTIRDKNGDVKRADWIPIDRVVFNAGA